MRNRHVVAAALGMFLALVVLSIFGEDVERFSVSPTPKPLMTVSPPGETYRETVRSFPEPTSIYNGRGFIPADKVRQIIQQNPDCWIGVPGATCEPGKRTFLGQE